MPEIAFFLSVWLSSEEEKEARERELRKRTLESVVSEWSLRSAVHWANTGVRWPPPSLHGCLLMLPSLCNLKIDRNDVKSRVLLPVPVPVLRVLPPSCFLLISTPWASYISVILNMERWRHKETKLMVSSLIIHFWDLYSAPYVSISSWHLPASLHSRRRSLLLTFIASLSRDVKESLEEKKKCGDVLF